MQFNDIKILYFVSGKLGLSEVFLYKVFLILYLIVIYVFLLLWFLHLELSVIFLTFIFLSSCIIILSQNLILIYLGLEFQGFSILVLIGSNKNSLVSIESIMKYFVLGALSSGFYLLGLSLIYSSVLTLNLSDMLLLGEEVKVQIGMVLISLVVLFKLGAAPFYHWLIDVYESVSWPVLGLLGSLPKISYLVVLYELCFFNKYILLISSMVCIVIGVLGGFNQTKIKRLLGYSTLNHTGLLLLILLLPGIDSFSVFIFYYIIYTLNFLGFTIICEKLNKNSKYLIDFIGLKYINGVLSISVIVLFLSLAGLPPLSGFLSKWFLIVNLIINNYVVFSLIIIFTSVLTIGYYLRLIKMLYFQSKSDFINWERILMKDKEKPVFIWLILSLLVYMSSLFIINPEILFLVINYFII
uniref:NADH:ubiquinone reductase (H(+)-translocating) n=1 Tax=Monoserius pennarius TaxID=2203294 RepID=A0AA96HTX5_9CNID|nr:NADH dehydrogenase subunit 2 [Monoserius pennarius]WNO18771.1 NADH dehydrogenase subunit 2 [Monoserius pennarius]